MEENNLTKLFQVYAEEPEAPVIELQNAQHKPVGAIYLKYFPYKKFYISGTNNEEKYYFFADGIGIYFTYFKKLNGNF